MFYQNKYAGWHIGSGYICRVAHGILIYWQGIMWYQNILARWYAGSEYVVRVIFWFRIYREGDMLHQNILAGWHVGSEYIGRVTCCVRIYWHGDMLCQNVLSGWHVGSRPSTSEHLSWLGIPGTLMTGRHGELWWLTDHQFTLGGSPWPSRPAPPSNAPASILSIGEVQNRLPFLTLIFDCHQILEYVCSSLADNITRTSGGVIRGRWRSSRGRWRGSRGIRKILSGLSQLPAV